MRDIKKAFVCAGWNLYTLRINPRFYLGLCLGLLLTLGYCLMLLLFSVLLGIGNANLSPQWSDTATMLSFSPGGFDPAFAVSRKMVKLTMPYPALLQIFGLLFLYMLLLSSVQLAFTVMKSRKTGAAIALLIGLTGFVLTPERFMAWLNLPREFQFYANLLSAWLSPLQHATYIMHNFGYDLLPRISTSSLILGGLSLLFFLLAAFKIRGYNFMFTGGTFDE